MDEILEYSNNNNIDLHNILAKSTKYYLYNCQEIGDYYINKITLPLPIYWDKNRSLSKKVSILKQVRKIRYATTKRSAIFTKHLLALLAMSCLPLKFLFLQHKHTYSYSGLSSLFWWYVIKSASRSQVPWTNLKNNNIIFVK